MMHRRDFIVLSLQALLLALFPWLRSERGARLAARAAEQLALFYMDGVPYSSWTAVYAAAMAKCGPATIEIDDSFGPAILPAGEYDLSGVTLAAV